MVNWFVRFQSCGRYVTLGPYASRKDALDGGLQYRPLAARRSLYTGYGANSPMFDLRWHDSDLLDEHARNSNITTRRSR